MNYEYTDQEPMAFRDQIRGLPDHTLKYLEDMYFQQMLVAANFSQMNFWEMHLLDIIEERLERIGAFDIFRK